MQVHVHIWCSTTTVPDAQLQTMAKMSRYAVKSQGTQFITICPGNSKQPSTIEFCVETQRDATILTPDRNSMTK